MRSSNVKGSLLVFASALCWSFSGILGKNLSWNGFSKTGVRAIVAVIVYALYRKSFKVRLSKSTWIGALGVSLTSLLYMLALTLTTSANAIVLQYSMPVYVVALNYLLFKTKPTFKQLIVVPLLMLGVALCCLGGSVGGEELRHQTAGNLIALLSGLTFSLVFLAGRMRGADSVQYTYFGNCLSLLLVVSVFFDKNVRFGFSVDIMKDWLLILLMGLSLGMGYLLLGIGLKSASPLSAAVLENLEPALNPVWVFLFLGERPGTLGIIGCAIVIVTVTLYSILPEKRKT
ncbi:MAG: DMT family transporter [Clostridia bacterium]|nr:DMT family transporter [Clostridia bacterium]